MIRMGKRLVLFFLQVVFTGPAFCQQNLLLNGDFEEINTCTEYKSECGVEAWFYLQDVKAQMLLNESNTKLTGANSFAIFYNWNGYTGFMPIIGTLLPCSLQKGNEYIFRGLISARINPKLILRPGICTGKKFYVPKRPFSKDLEPDSILSLKKIPNTAFFEFEYRFTSDGDERFLTFGSFITEDTTGAKKRLIGTQTVSLVLDNFKLEPVNPEETICNAYRYNKESIYEFNARHKEMDYALFGKGDLPIKLKENEKDNITVIQKKPIPLKADTLKLGDVLFDFNKAGLKPAAVKTLEDFFIKSSGKKGIDSIYIEGHTDSIGSDVRNLQLSTERSESIRQWMVAHQIIPEEKLQIRAFGRSRPIATNKTPQGRALNRRVELIIFRKRE